jgi:triacylglycerol esterase/lipase EstA (alpha/beta hydrolase family)
VVALAATAICLIAAAPAAADRVVTIDGARPKGTPASLDKVQIVQTGPARAKHVLVLVPGTSAGAPYFRPLAQAIVARMPGWQVWSVERRENLLEDQSVLDQVKAGAATGQQLFDYYLGWIGANTTAPRFTPKTDAETAYARDWGMAVAVGDLHNVIRLARKGGRSVALGGHSLGGSIIDAYATWDFDGKAGGEDLNGLVFIDGGSAAGTAITPEQAQESLTALSTTSPFLDLTGMGLPWSAGVFNAVGSTTTLKEPNAPSLLQSWSFLPAELKPPVAATNIASYGFALDDKTGPKSLALVQSHIGHLADSGDPRGWVDDGLTTASRVATVFSGIPGMDGTAWYHPRRLSIDAGAVNGGIANPAARALGVKATHGKDLKTPIYAYETSLGKGRVLKAAASIAKQAGIPRRSVTLVDRSTTNSHIDPISDTPGRNDFLATVMPFLKKLK